MSPWRRYAGSRRDGVRRRIRWVMLIALAFGAFRFALFLASRAPAPAGHDAGDLSANAESVAAAARLRDGAGVEASAERLAAEQPRNADALCQLALALHNRNVAMTTRFSRPHPAQRLALDRMAVEMRVLALLDSAAHVAQTPEQGARALTMRGQAFESLGLPIEALECYRAASARAPRNERAALQLRRLSAQLAEPRARYPVASDSTGSPASTQPR